MPPSRSAATAGPSRTGRSRDTTSQRRPVDPLVFSPQRVPIVRSLAGIRWDRIGRISLLVTLVIVGVIGTQRVMSYLATRAEAARAQALVHQLTRENARLEAQQRALSQPATIAADARKLGMVRIGEHPYAVTSNH